MAKIEQVLHELNVRTEAGKIRWKAAGPEGYFTTSAGRYTVMVSGPESIAGEESLKVLDQRGDVLDQLSAGEPGSDPETSRELHSLHEAARRQALRVESHLDLLLREIKGIASARLVGTEQGEIRIGGEVWQPMQALIEYLEPQVSSGLAPWQPGTRASRGDAERIQRAIHRMLDNPNALTQFLEDTGFKTRATTEGIEYTMGVFRLPKGEIERLDQFLKECRGFTIEPA